MASVRKRMARMVFPKKSPEFRVSVISECEAKMQFSRLLDRVAHGEEIVIVCDGEPVARLVLIVRNRITEILGRDQGKIHVPDDFNNSMDWTDEERMAFDP